MGELSDKAITEAMRDSGYSWEAIKNVSFDKVREEYEHILDTALEDAIFTKAEHDFEENHRKGIAT